MKLEGKVAIVTGGASGIGQATAALFAQEGAKVVLADVREREGEKIAEEIQEKGGEALFVRTDVARGEEVAALVDRAVAAYGRLDIMVNNAGVALIKDILETTEEDWDRVLNVNLKGVFWGCKYAIAAMRRNSGGSIVNIASIAGLFGMNQRVAYCASKAGVVNLTRSLALDYSKEGIRINCICPGAIKTPLLGAHHNLEDPAVLNRLGAAHPVGKIGEPEDIARMALFLASNDSAFVTGSVFSADGGLFAGRIF